MGAGGAIGFVILFVIPAGIAAFSMLLGVICAPKWAPWTLIVAPIAVLEVAHAIESSSKLSIDNTNSTPLGNVLTHLTMFFITMAVVLLVSLPSYKLGKKISRRLARL